MGWCAGGEFDAKIFRAVSPRQIFFCHFPANSNNHSVLTLKAATTTSSDRRQIFRHSNSGLHHWLLAHPRPTERTHLTAMGKRSREAAAGETFPEGKSKKRKKDGKEPKEKKKRLRELQKDIVGLPEEEEEVQEEAVEDGEAEAVSKKAEKKEKKRKMKEEKKAAEAKEEELKESEEATEAGAEEAKTKVSKGDAKNKVPKDDAKNKVPKDDADLEEEAAAAEGRKPRFIVFVGTFPSIFFSHPPSLPGEPSLTLAPPRKPPLLRHGRKHRGALQAAAPDLHPVPQPARRPDQVPRVRVRRVHELQEHPDVPGQVAPLDVR